MLYQESRPHNLGEIIGNDSLIESLKGVLSDQDRPHVFLFAGPSGTGKTTIARVLAKEFGAENFNIIELNAASTRGIDTVRDKIEKVCKYSPLDGGTRVFIYDECHQFSKDAMNALLKILEDVPPYQYHILCSTDPQKIIPTIRNRCATYETKLLRKPQLEEVIRTSWARLYKDELGEEEVKWAAKNAQGSPRKALMIIEQLLNIQGKEEFLAEIKDTEGEILDFCRTVMKAGRWQDIIKAYTALGKVDIERIRRAMAGYIKGCILKSNDSELGKFTIALTIITDSFPMTQMDEAALLAKIAEIHLTIKKGDV